MAGKVLKKLLVIRYLLKLKELIDMNHHCKNLFKIQAFTQYDTFSFIHVIVKLMIILHFFPLNKCLKAYNFQVPQKSLLMVLLKFSTAQNSCSVRENLFHQLKLNFPSPSFQCIFKQPTSKFLFQKSSKLTMFRNFWYIVYYITLTTWFHTKTI